ncbi:MAG: universal stress protein [Kribbellaceae bacterium]|nr:universal stress protein [Kribbellaceae bacterium]
MSTDAIVVECDSHEFSRSVIDYAATEAARTGAELVLAMHNDANVSTDEASSLLRRAARDLDSVYRSRLKVGTMMLDGPRTKALIAAGDCARLVVVGKAAGGELTGLRAAQGSLRIATAVSCPVIVVPTTWRSSPMARSVVVGVDGTPLSQDAVNYAFAVADTRGLNVSVVHSYWMGYGRSGAANRPGPAGAWVNAARSTVSDSLAGCIDAYPHVRVSRVLTTRPVIDTLISESRYAELVVLGAHAGGGSIADPTTRRAIAEMTCPVAIVAHRRVRLSHMGHD